MPSWKSVRPTSAASRVSPRRAVLPARSQTVSPDWRVWLLAARPATLPAAVAPVLAGSAAATVDTDFRVAGFGVALFAAMFIQIGTNFANDRSDFQRGADAPGRLGPRRATQAGIVTAAQMRTALLVAFALATVAGVYLIILAGWPLLIVGLASIAAGYTYTGGPWPYGYHGFGDLFVFVFFGIVAGMGSYFVQRESLTWEALAVALPVAMTVTAILVVNNLRDVETDRRSGKRTLAVILGARAARLEYGAFVLGAFALMPIFAAADLLPWEAMQTWVALPAALWLVWQVGTGTSGRPLNLILKRTGQVHLALGALLAMAFLW